MLHNNIGEEKVKAKKSLASPLDDRRCLLVVLSTKSLGPRLVEESRQWVSLRKNHRPSPRGRIAVPLLEEESQCLSATEDDGGFPRQRKSVALLHEENRRLHAEFNQR
ncbi:unnamed protein product [Eruca vesicaria subsp. sativa]|uniref:Uncharacterized protein n=1 Tax=Eruca vesicaria subsp. sativa TaxID=29727 RepID=A0ABC8K2W9_ERUVS|nr:unnamed protein product [Eruca vesicaria subsp. sativa]